MSRLAPLRFGTTAGPESPPLSMPSGVSRMSLAFAVVRLWQARQLFFRMGTMSFLKSTGVERLICAMGIGLGGFSADLVSSARTGSRDWNTRIKAAVVRKPGEGAIPLGAGLELDSWGTGKSAVP